MHWPSSSRSSIECCLQRPCKLAGEPASTCRGSQSRSNAADGFGKSTVHLLYRPGYYSAPFRVILSGWGCGSVLWIWISAFLTLGRRSVRKGEWKSERKKGCGEEDARRRGLRTEQGIQSSAEVPSDLRCTRLYLICCLTQTSSSELDGGGKQTGSSRSFFGKRMRTNKPRCQAVQRRNSASQEFPRPSYPVNTQ